MNNNNTEEKSWARTNIVAPLVVAGILALVGALNKDVFAQFYNNTYDYIYCAFNQDQCGE